MIQSIIGTSFTGGGYNPPPVTFVASNYNPIEGTTITFTISGITGVSEGTTLYWWIDGTSGQFSRADQFLENIDNSTLQLSPDGNGALGGTFTLTPNRGDISFNFYIGYSLYGGFLNLPSDVFVTNVVNDFTIEWWQKMETSVGDYDALFNVGNNLRFSEQLQGNNLTIWTGNSGTGISNQNIPGLYNTWVHFAIVRDSNIIKLYKNGTSLFSSTNNSLIQNNSDVLQIANGFDNYFQGYITNFHFLKDVAKYNGNFTPSTTPLNPTEFIQTKLLLSVTSSNTAFIDSTGNHVASVIGGTWSSESPFSDGSGSIYFDGSSYLGFPGSVDWAIDVVETFPFEVTANWSLTTPPVTDDASFKIFLESGDDGGGGQNSLTDVVITDFSLVGNRLVCNLSANGTILYLNNIQISDIVSFGNIIGLQQLRLNNNQIITFDPTIALPSGLQELYLGSNQIITFDPSIALPSSLQSLILGSNDIVTFDPGIALPTGLQNLLLNSNQIVTFDPSIALPTGLQQLNLADNNIVTFDPSIALPNSLTVLYLFYNQIVTFNPSIALPNSLLELNVNNNQMTTAGYVASEPWANSMSVIPGRGSIFFMNNINSVSGTNLRTILIAKGWIVY